MIKGFFTRIALVTSFALLASGCVGQGHREYTDASKLIGKWSGQQNGFEMGKPVTKDIKFEITEAKGNAFTGYKTGSWLADGQKELINGVIGEEGSIYISDEDGYTVGKIKPNGNIWLVYLEASKDDSSAIDSLVKKID
jgi:hypothetical protein